MLRAFAPGWLLATNFDSSSSNPTSTGMPRHRRASPDRYGQDAAFGIPILEMLDPLSETRYPQALILVPTRELAEQVHQEIVKLAWGCPTATLVTAGGKHMRQQIEALSKGRSNWS